MKKIILVLFVLLSIQKIKAQCWIEVAAGWSHTIAIKSDGTLWAWGKNDLGQLGDGTTTTRLSAVQIGTASNWVKIATGYNHNLALQSNGTLWAWGNNSAGQLGDNSLLPHLAPVQVGLDNNWQALAVGNSHSLAIKNDGTLWSWGDNAQGQLGRLGGNNLVPVQVGSATDWQQVVAGNAHSMAIKQNGTLWVWGGSGNSQLGFGNTLAVSTPQQLGSFTWNSIAAGETHSFGIRNNGTLWAWGNNTSGQLGLPISSMVLTPTQVGTASNWIKISTGLNHSIGMTADFVLHATGDNTYGQLGDNSMTSTSQFTPVCPSCLTTVSVSCGGIHSTSLNSNAELWLWGNNAFGELGTGNMLNQLVPSLTTILWYLDADGDHYYTGQPIANCYNPGLNYVTASGILGGGDFDDTNPGINPGEFSFLTTDTTWKATDTLYPNWQLPTFNDQLWGNALELSTGTFNNQTGAKFIWNNVSASQSNTAYLRKSFYVSNNLCQVLLGAAIDDDMEIYINGNLVVQDTNNLAGPEYVDINVSFYLIPNAVNVIAVKAINTQCCYQGFHLQISNSDSWYLDNDGDFYTVGSAIHQCASPGPNYIKTGILGYNDCNDNNDVIGECNLPSRMVLNGSTDYVTAGNIGTCTDEGSISFIFNWTGQGTYPNVLSTNFQNNGSTIDAGFSFQVYGGGLVAIVSSNGSSYNLHQLIPNGLVPNQNYHIVLTWDKPNNTVTGYTNGIKIFENSNTYWPSTHGNLCMGIGSVSDRNFPGTMDDVSIWDKQVSQEEVYHLLHSDINSNDPYLRAYYSFNTNTIGGPGIVVPNESITTLGLYNGLTVGSFPNTPYFGNVLYMPFNSPPSLSASSTNFCAGQAVTFTAQSGYSAPLSYYKFYVNGINVQTSTSPIFTTSSLNSLDEVYCEEFNNYIYYDTVLQKSNTLVLTDTCLSQGAATCLKFDGLDDYVEISDGGGLANLQSGTIEMWVKWVGTNQDMSACATYGCVMGRQLNNSFSNQVLGLSHPDPAIGKLVWMPYGGCANSLQSNISPGYGWNHIAIVYSNGNHTLYLNGTLVGNAPLVGSISPTQVPLSLGAWIGDGSSYADVLLDEVRIWNVERSAAQIQQYMNCEIFTPQDNLINVYHFNDGFASGNNLSNNTLFSSTNNTNGVLTNFALTGSTSNWVTGSPIVTGNYCEVPVVVVQCFLQGYYAGSGMMNSPINNSGINLNPSLADSLTLSLYDPSTMTMVGTRTSTINPYGYIGCDFPGIAYGSYYLKVNSRNHIETWSAQPVVINNVLTYYDFTNNLNKAYGDNQVELEPGVFGFYCGDINQDDAIDGFDYLLLEPDIVLGNFGYLVTDLNGDGAVDGFDYLKLEANIIAGIGAATP